MCPKPTTADESYALTGSFMCSSLRIQEEASRQMACDREPVHCTWVENWWPGDAVSEYESTQMSSPGMSTCILRRCLTLTVTTCSVALHSCLPGHLTPSRGGGQQKDPRGWRRTPPCQCR